MVWCFCLKVLHYVTFLGVTYFEKCGSCFYKIRIFMFSFRPCRYLGVKPASESYNLLEAFLLRLGERVSQRFHNP